MSVALPVTVNILFEGKTVKVGEESNPPAEKSDMEARPPNTPRDRGTVSDRRWCENPRLEKSVTQEGMGYMAGLDLESEHIEKISRHW